jgi:glutathione synthase/RimK-type ligase-like ATP-grasp enzyme
MSSQGQPRLVGLLVGQENTFPQPFLDAVNTKGAAAGVLAEMAVLGGTSEWERPRHSVIVDRISHEVPYYRAHLKSVSLMGAVVVNDPFWWEADEKFFECTLARRLGVAVPRTVALPNKEYIPAINPQGSLRNLAYPLDWERIAAFTGLPAVLKPNTGGGWKDVHVVHSLDELIAAYDGSGLKTMILQEFIEWEDYLRCICIGRQHILPLRYEPRNEFHERYQVSRPPEGALRDAAVAQARVLCDALGYDMNTVEFAVRGGVLYAIDFLNPAPDFDSFSIKDEAFGWVLERMSDLVIAYATGAAAPPWRGEYRWWRKLQPPVPAGQPAAAGPKPG